MPIRTATNLDRDDIQAVYLSAFAEEERAVVAKCADDLLSLQSTPPTLSLVAELEENLVGHVAFSPVTISGNGNFQGYILAPLAVAPGYQRRGIGSQLIGSGMQRLSDTGVDVLFVYGDPKYYGRFGFSADIAAGFVPPYRLQFSFGWQGVFLGGQERERAAGTLACVEPLRDPELW